MRDSELTPPAVNNTVETTGENWMGSEDLMVVMYQYLFPDLDLVMVM